MIHTGNDATRHTLELLPHQAALVETVFDSKSKRIILLRAATGLGKGRAIIAVAARLMREQPSARALILVPGPLRFQFAQMLRDEGVPSLLVDRYVYRELIDRTTEDTIWPSASVAVMSIDFAKQAEIRASLASTKWDLLIVDELHMMKGERAATVRLVDANRVLLVSATPIIEEEGGQLSGADFTTVDWQYGLKDTEGNPLAPFPSIALHQTVFSLDENESRLCEEALNFAKALGGSISKVNGSMLLRCLESSPAAFEAALQRLMGSAQTDPAESLDEPDEFDEIQLQGSRISTEQRVSGSKEISEIAEGLLRRVEGTVSDTKLDNLRGQLTPLIAQGTNSRRIVVLTNYIATLYYLAADLEDRGLQCKVLHSGLGAEERRNSLEQFLNGNVILVATPAEMSYGVDLPSVTDLVLYDVPRRRDILLSIIGRFSRIGKRTNLNMYVSTHHSDMAYQLRDVLEQIADHCSRNDKQN